MRHHAVDRGVSGDVQAVVVEGGFNLCEESRVAGLATEMM
jgi:hypothetical protein